MYSGLFSTHLSFFQAKVIITKISNTWMLKIENRENIDEFQPKFITKHSWVKVIQVYLNEKSHPFNRETTFTNCFISQSILWYIIIIFYKCVDLYESVSQLSDMAHGHLVFIIF